MLANGKSCPICNSRFQIEMQNIYLQRQRTVTQQYFCMDCQSFFHRSGYKEPEAQFVGDTKWLLDHPGDYRSSIDVLKSMFPKAKTCFEAGCGVGTLLSQLKEKGFAASGVDPNPIAVEYAQTHYGVDATWGYFDTLSSPVDVVFAIDVLEHLEDPRTFFAALVASTKRDGAIVVRVPTVDRNRWHYLYTADQDGQKESHDPFMDNSVHITHFSTLGVMKMAEDFGCRFLIRGTDRDLFVFSAT